MRTSIARVATAAIALAMVGGAGLAAATHAAAATDHHTCTTLVYVPAVKGPKGSFPPLLIGTGCDNAGSGAVWKPGTVTGPVVGWAKPRTFSYVNTLCLVGHLTCKFNSVRLLPD